MKPWLELCRAAAGDVAAGLARLGSRDERERAHGTGVGGDETAEVDVVAETAVLARLEALHSRGVSFHLVSEELGERTFGAAPTWWVVVDPIDGSVNAKRGLPYYSLSVAVATGPTMADVVFGFVKDLASGEEWVAERGRGARLNGAPLRDRPKEPIELLALEATTAPLMARALPALAPHAARIRVMGSLALALCHLAAGRLDAVASLRPVRSVDVAAAQLLLREQGSAIVQVDGSTLDGCGLDLGVRPWIVAAATPAGCRPLAAALVDGTPG
ncbi:MAG: inositol monophosphatase family protein [Thermoleophilia bacterium]